MAVAHGSCLALLACDACDYEKQAWADPCPDWVLGYQLGPSPCPDHPSDLNLASGKRGVKSVIAGRECVT